MRSQIDADIDRTDIRQEGEIVTIDIPDMLEGGNGVLLDMSPKQLRILHGKIEGFIWEKEQERRKK